jgi:hypothetical protein
MDKKATTNYQNRIAKLTRCQPNQAKIPPRRSFDDESRDRLRTAYVLNRIGELARIESIE